MNMSATRVGQRAIRNTLTILTWITFAGTALLTPHSAFARDARWPERPVRLIAAVPAGSAPDVIARVLATELSALWQQPVVVDNRPGAGGIIGMEAARAAASDGYTLIMPHASAAVVTPVTYNSATYDIERDFTLISTVAYTPIAMIANLDAPAHNLQELIEQSERHPGKIDMGNPGHTTSAHLAAELLNQEAGAKLFHVPFNANGLQAVIGGDVPYYIDGIARLLPMVRAKRARPIAVFAAEKLDGLDEFPLATDVDPALSVTGWFIVAGPAGLPEGIVRKVNQDVNTVLAKADVAAKFLEFGTYPQPGSVAETTAFVKEEKDRYAKIIRNAGIKAQ